MAKKTFQCGLPYLTTGPKKLVAHLNAVSALLDALRVHRSLDIDSLVTPEGTLLTLRNPSAGARPSGNATLLDPYAVVVPDFTTVAAHATITYAMPSGVLYDVVALDLDTAYDPDIRIRQSGNWPISRDHATRMLMSFYLDGYRPFFSVIAFT